MKIINFNKKFMCIFSAICISTCVVQSNWFSVANSLEINSKRSRTLENRDTDKAKTNIPVRFMIDDNVIKTLQVDFDGKDYTIYDSNLPENPIRKGKDFLGWFWRIKSSGDEYKAIFPFKLSLIPETLHSELSNGVTFYAKFGKNIPGNQLQKQGYRLIFHDEFNENNLDTKYWVNKYLSSWSTTSQNASNYLVNNGHLQLQINQNSQPWCPEFDGQTIVSGISTGNRNSLHNWTGKNIVRNPDKTELTHINQYGYYEMRMKGQPGSARHSAWWLLGFEDTPEQSAEIDIMEVQGRDNHKVPPNLHSWRDKIAFPHFTGLRLYYDKNKSFNDEYHVYGFDWQKGTGTRSGYPDRIVFYVDGNEYAKVSVNIDYPMIQLLSLYEKRSGGWTGSWQWEPYPNTMDIDYVRVYKKLPKNQHNLSSDQLHIVSIIAENPIVGNKDINTKSYDINGDGIKDYYEKNILGTRSYVRVNWSDGIETQEPVTWDPITEDDISKLRSGKTVMKRGIVNIVSLQKHSSHVTHMVITPEFSANNMKRYSSNGLVPVEPHAIDNLFNGEITNRYKTGVFDFKPSHLKQEKISINYKFDKCRSISGIEFYANYGNDQAIKKFKLSTSKDGINWENIKDGQKDMIFTIPWKTSQVHIERQYIKIPAAILKNSFKYYRIIPVDIGNTWHHMAMSEIHFVSK